MNDNNGNDNDDVDEIIFFDWQHFHESLRRISYSDIALGDNTFFT